MFSNPRLSTLCSSHRCTLDSKRIFVASETRPAAAHFLAAHFGHFHFASFLPARRLFRLLAHERHGELRASQLGQEPRAKALSLLASCCRAPPPRPPLCSSVYRVRVTRLELLYCIRPLLVVFCGVCDQSRALHLALTLRHAPANSSFLASLPRLVHWLCSRSRSHSRSRSRSPRRRRSSSGSRSPPPRKSPEVRKSSSKSKARAASPPSSRSASHSRSRSASPPPAAPVAKVPAENNDHEDE
jgi:hypothetical protein